VCEVVAAYVCRPFIAPQKRILWNYTLQCSSVCYVLGSV
jgi:hypothetical protein